MKFNFQNKLILVFVLVGFQAVIGQKGKGIGSEEVTVVKPYSPSISDANKIQEIPPVDDNANTKKEAIKYSIFSFPVASTFAPLKGKAQGVDPMEKEHLYTNYATLGFGNYRTLNAELFVNQDLKNNDYVGGMFRHLSSQGGIDGVELDDRFYTTSIDLTYGASYDYMTWNLDLGYQNQIYNWYGLPETFGTLITPQERKDIISSINPQHAYNSFSVGGKMIYNEGFFNQALMKYTHFSDTFDTSENHFYFKPTIQFNVKDELVNTDIIVDYAGGSFKNNYVKTNASPIKYGYTNIGISPSFVLEKEDWTLNIGASLYYSMDIENNENSVFVYPKFNASCNIVGDLMIFYAGAEGDLKQNTYQNFVDGNPYLSPTMDDATSPNFIKPTDKQYDIFAGLKGKLANNVSYNLRASYINERNKALYKSNNYNEDAGNEVYAFGNSFGIVYDDIKTLQFSGDLKADFSDKVTFSVSGMVSDYSNYLQQEAWNLPTVTISSTIDFDVTEKWFAGASVFYVGERKDLQLNTDIINIVAPDAITLESYFDVNGHVGYKHNDRLTGYLKANNILNKNYQKWLNYPVQGFQIVVGANYKFDF